MSNHSVIEHRANYHYVKMEEDYTLICSTGKQYPHCKALILSVLEHWTNDKLDKGLDTYIYMTYPEWIDSLYGLFRRNTIISCLNELVSDKFISKRSCQRHGKDTFEYCLNVEIVQAKIKELEERSNKNTRPKVNAFKFKRVQKQTANDGSGIQIQTGNAFKSKPNIDSITETSSNIDTYVNADALTRTHSSQENENENYYQHSDGSSAQDIHSDQASTDYPIATTPPQTALIGVATRNTESLPKVMPPAPDKENSNGHTPRKFAPPVMPPDDVAWNAETLVQVLEARQGRRFPNGAQKKVNRVRDQALRDAEAIIDMGDIDRVAFVLAVNHLENRKNKWWLDNVGHVQPRHLLKNDKIHEMIDELKRQYGPSWREKLMQKNTATRKPSGPLATLPPPPKSNAELRMEAV